MRPKKQIWGAGESSSALARSCQAQTPEGSETLGIFPQLPKPPSRAAPPVSGGNQRCWGEQKIEIFVFSGRFSGVSCRGRGRLGVQVLNSKPWEAPWEFPWSQRGLKPVVTPAQILTALLPLWHLTAFPFRAIPGILCPGNLTWPPWDSVSRHGNPWNSELSQSCGCSAGAGGFTTELQIFGASYSRFRPS